MKGNPMERCVDVGRYIADNHCTVRQAAEHFGVSKSTVHKDISKRLAKRRPDVYEQAMAVLKHNRATRHIRGGEATRRKYQR